MRKMITLSSAQRDLVAGHIDVVEWAIYKCIKVREDVYGLSYDDLYQEGCICLCKAAATYDSSRAQFATYAKVVVQNGLIGYCRTLQKKQQSAIGMAVGLRDLGSNLPDADNGSAGDIYEALLSEVAVYSLLETVKAEYSGVARLGVEALELKVRGYSGADIAGMWGVKQSQLGAWISRAKQKLLSNEQFMAGLRAGLE